MFKVKLSLLLLIVLLFSCKESGKELKERVLRGPVKAGGVFRMNEVEDFRKLYPLSISEEVGYHIASQIYEGLVKPDAADLTIKPCLAESYTISNDGLVYTFHLRKDVLFQDDACFPGGRGRALQASDVKWCLDKLCEKNPENELFPITFRDRVLGANAYYATEPSDAGVKGIRVLDMYSLEITLTQPCASFLNILSTPGCWVYPKEAYAKYPDQLNSHPLGTGPFVAKGIKRGEYVVLARNERYWGRDGYGNVLPYLDGIHFAFVKDKKAEFLKFRNNELDMVFPIPVDLLHELKKEIHDAPAGRPPFNMQLVPALRISYYGFQHALPPFDNVKVRQAFNLAVDKHEIVSFILEGAGTAGEYGIVPPGIKGYDTAGFRAYPFNPVRARALLSEAGYPGGRGFPALLLEVNGSGSDRNSVLAGVVSKMLKDNLNVDVRIDPVATAQDLDELNETAKTHFFYSTWTADYPDPETFLTMLYSKHIPASLNERSPLNTVRYRSSTFDSLFELAAKESASDKRYELYRLADQVATADAAIMPIFYDQIQRLVQTNVRNFKANAMEYRDMTEVWLEK